MRLGKRESQQLSGPSCSTARQVPAQTLVERVYVGAAGQVCGHIELDLVLTLARAGYNLPGDPAGWMGKVTVPDLRRDDPAALVGDDR
jgi:hypothetical protein